MVNLEKFDEAMHTLGKDEGAEAEKIRSQIYWKNKDWKNLSTTVENILKLRKDITAPIADEESKYVLQLGISYIFLDNREQLQYLRDYFTPLMEKSSNKKVFDFITAQDIRIGTRNFDAVMKSMEQMGSFVDKYSEKEFSKDSGELGNENKTLQ